MAFAHCLARRILRRVVDPMFTDGPRAKPSLAFAHLVARRIRRRVL
jgi:hypothetical protein